MFHIIRLPCKEASEDGRYQRDGLKSVTPTWDAWG